MCDIYLSPVDQGNLSSLLNHHGIVVVRTQQATIREAILNNKKLICCEKNSYYADPPPPLGSPYFLWSKQIFYDNMGYEILEIFFVIKDGFPQQAIRTHARLAIAAKKKFPISDAVSSYYTLQYKYSRVQYKYPYTPNPQYSERRQKGGIYNWVFCDFERFPLPSKFTIIRHIKAFHTCFANCVEKLNAFQTHQLASVCIANVGKLRLAGCRRIYSGTILFLPRQFLATPRCGSDTGIYTALRNCTFALEMFSPNSLEQPGSFKQDAKMQATVAK